ncbi:MAG: hypothetical protein LWW83_05655 [Azonexaceae bacterium]|uniref:hypothetical protein n=1 Tax=Azonexus sp. R2A61 TaxID=2744443 RepID=UPI001F3A3219|nr:hypothetical protein [Azonexus sp. R2A61]MCE1239392.1 hypothetical protein [Azonexaceae bacterium]
MGVIFAKTPKGQVEVAARSGGLTPRQRRVLIMVDGRRTVEQLREMLQTDDLQHTLGLLEESGFIEIAGLTDEAGRHHPPPDTPLPAITAFRPAPAPANEKELEMARNFIQNTLKTFCGPYAHLHIVEAAYAAKTHDELRQQFDPWFHAIVQTREGRRRAEELRGLLLKVI